VLVICLNESEGGEGMAVEVGVMMLMMMMIGVVGMDSCRGGGDAVLVQRASGGGAV
jgi:hypothetical protein